MGRSVSCATGSVHVAYSKMDLDWTDPDQAQDDWQWHRDNYVAAMSRSFPSLRECDFWLGSENHVLLQNDYAQIGVSEYCGLVSMWVVPVEATFYSAPGFDGLRDRWLDQIHDKFYATASGCFGTALAKLGHMSNGVGVYRRIGAASAA